MAAAQLDKLTKNHRIVGGLLKLLKVDGFL